jgi:pyruvate carboxylase
MPNAHLQPVDFDKEFEEFLNKFDSYQTFLDFLSWKFYPKVFEEYYQFGKVYGDISHVPTTAFFYGMKPNEEIIVEIAQGKNILVRLLYVGSHIDEDGQRTVYFRLNGQTRSIEVVDKKALIKKILHTKAKGEKQIGAPLQGRLSKIFVKPDQEVKKNAPLFTIEAMKMETTITATTDAVIQNILLKEGTMVEADDLVIEMK